MKIPGKATISNRTSTMASQFARARAPYSVPTPDQLAHRYQLFQMKPDKPECIYCGGPPTEWDHLFPMVFQSQWTGYTTEISNLVPACGKCNQSRGSKQVAAWMRSDAIWSPLRIFQSRDGMTSLEAHAEVNRRITMIDTAITLDPPARYSINKEDADEIELEECRVELNALLYRAETIASRLRARYQSHENDHLPAGDEIG